MTRAMISSCFPAVYRTAYGMSTQVTGALITLIREIYRFQVLHKSHWLHCFIASGRMDTGDLAMREETRCELDAANP